MDDLHTQHNELPNQPETTPETPYTPRPAWQIWAARIGLVVVIAAFALYLYQIATGGM